jgi:hypothetical protein
MSESPKNKKEITEEFKQKIVRWVKLDDDLRKLRETVKEINDEKKQSEEYILAFMENIEEKEIAITDGKLTRQVSKLPEPLNKDNIQKAIAEVTKNESKAKELTDYILSSRKTKEKVALKRTKIRV